MVAALPIDDEKKALEWLSGNPATWSRVIAFRCALRSLPVLVGSGRSDSDDDALVRPLLAYFRAVLTAHLGLRESGDDDAIDKWADAATGFSASARSSTSESSIRDVLSAVELAVSPTPFDPEAMSSVVAADWGEVSKDLAFLRGRSGTEAGLRLIDMPIWAGEGDSGEHARLLKADSGVFLDRGFKPWFDWYSALGALEGGSSRDVFGPSLSRRIVLQVDEWWDRGAKVVNADIAMWLAEGHAESAVDSEPEALDTPLPQSPAAKIFGGINGTDAARPHGDFVFDESAAALFLNELRDKAAALSGLFVNSSPWMCEQIEKLAKSLPENVGDLKPYLLHARMTPIRAVMARLSAFEEEGMFSAETCARLCELADIGADLEALFPALRALEAEKRGLSLVEVRTADIRAESDADVAAAASSAPVVDVIAGDALAEALVDAVIESEKVRPTHDHSALSVRNLFVELAEFWREVVSRARPHFVEGAVEGIGRLGLPLAVALPAALLWTIAGPIWGLAVFAAGYGLIDNALKNLLAFYSSQHVPPQVPDAAPPVGKSKTPRPPDSQYLIRGAKSWLVDETTMKGTRLPKP